MVNGNELEMLFSVITKPLYHFQKKAGCQLKGCHIITTMAFSDFAEKFQLHKMVINKCNKN